ncbi:MAG: 30S ribosomal protein S2 [Candidatus Aenigmatarchaeota archaeon]
MPRKAPAKERLMIPRTMYLAAGTHIGMTFKTASMARFIYNVRPNGLAVLNIGELDRRIGLAASMIANAKTPLIVCRKDIGWAAVRKFGEVTGVKFQTGRFMPGSLTNPTYAEFTEPDLILAIDPVADRQAILEAAKARIPIISLADTSHDTSYIDLVLPCNNKGKKSLALVFWGIASQLAAKQGKEFTLKVEDFGWE